MESVALLSSFSAAGVNGRCMCGYCDGIVIIINAHAPGQGPGVI